MQKVENYYIIYSVNSDGKNHIYKVTNIEDINAIIYHYVVMKDVL